VDYFLTTVSKYYNIYLFTASSPAYANAIVDYLDPKSSYILGILTRGNCMETKNGFFVKDLRVLKDKKMKDIIMVDNLAHSFGFQLDNGVPILEWHHDPKD
jgi:CTD small phosphatase-like protein 2